MEDKDQLNSLFLDAEIGIGAMAWGDRVVWNYGRDFNESDVEAAINISLENKINFVDTAEIYGQGHSERLIGQYYKKNNSSLKVATKFFPYPWRILKSSFVRALKGSLVRLGLDYVDLYQIHWPFPPRSIETWVEALGEACQLGLAKHVGVSNYNRNQMQRALTILSKVNIPLISNQVEYNLINRNIERNGLLNRCQELGIKVIAYSPLAKGLLSGKYTPENPPPGIRSRQFGTMLREIQPLIRKLTEIGQDVGGKTPAQVSLNWIICKGAFPIPGIKNAEQAEQNAGAAGWRLTEDQVSALDEASERFIK